MSERQVKSRKRVADHGEVFTAQREVNAMLDLVKQETERIDSRFLDANKSRGIALKCSQIQSKLHLTAFRYTL